MALCNDDPHHEGANDQRRRHHQHSNIVIQVAVSGKDSETEGEKPADHEQRIAHKSRVARRHSEPLGSAGLATGCNIMWACRL